MNEELNKTIENQERHFQLTVSKALAISLVIIVCMQFVAGFLMLPTQFMESLTHLLLPVSFLVGGVTAIFVGIVMAQTSWSAIKAHIYTPSSLALLFLSCLLFIALLPFTEFLTSMVPTQGIPWLEEFYKLVVENFDHMLNFKIAGFITICLLAPLLEEILFRGILLRGLLQKGISPIFAIVLSSFLFGLAHLNPWQFLGAGFLGAIFGFVYYRTQALWLPIFLHALNNTISFIFMVMYGTMDENLTETSDFQLVSLSFVLAVIVGWTIYKLTQNRVKWN